MRAYDIYVQVVHVNVSEIERVSAEEASGVISDIKTSSVELLNKWLKLSSYSFFYFFFFIVLQVSSVN